MRPGVILAVLATCSMAQQLRVASANTKSVRLEWSTSAQEWTVERKTEAGTYEKLASSNATSYEDKTIAPYATYRYRVSAGGKTSNEVVVGPPPAGILT